MCFVPELITFIIWLFSQLSHNHFVYETLDKKRELTSTSCAKLKDIQFVFRHMRQKEEQLILMLEKLNNKSIFIMVQSQRVVKFYKYSHINNSCSSAGL